MRIFQKGTGALLAGIPTRSPSFNAAGSAAEIQRFDPRRAITTSGLSAGKASPACRLIRSVESCGK